ncbi:hypothetical protein ACFY5J_26065 [Peribacillus butanolivorans]|uniref:hypothetical protein n=1 Tax=Peribacillus butanolivorans TaxID=421767 RepID=UPI00366E3185
MGKSPFITGRRAGIKLHVSYSPLTEMPLQVVRTTGLVHDGPIVEQLVDFTIYHGRKSSLF